ncbi:MAG: glycosyltransferase family 4 protein [Cyclobacteriaceae bacterium]
MKIAVVTNTSWNIFNFRLDLVRALQAERHEVILIAPADKYSGRLRDMGLVLHEVNMDSRGVNPVKDAALTLELHQLYKKLQLDLVLHFTVKPNIYGTLAASRLKIPVINNVCGLGTVFLQQGMVSVIAKWLYRVSFRFAEKVFFHNPDDYQLFIEQRLLKQSKADIVPGSGIDTKRFQPAFHMVTQSDTFTFLVISRLIYDKGIVEYIEAARHLRAQGLPVRFQLLGAKDPIHKRGIPMHLIDQWIKSGVVEYLGTTDDVRSAIHHADCVVLPSYREGLPRTLLEAASLQKPIVATDTPGCRHVVEDGVNGLLCKARDAGDLAEKMLMITQLTKEEVHVMGERGREMVKAKFSQQVVINKYVRAIEEMDAKYQTVS